MWGSFATSAVKDGPRPAPSTTQAKKYVKKSASARIWDNIWGKRATVDRRKPFASSGKTKAPVRERTAAICVRDASARDPRKKSARKSRGSYLEGDRGDDPSLRETTSYRVNRGTWDKCPDHPLGNYHRTRWTTLTLSEEPPNGPSLITYLNIVVTAYL